MRFWFWSSTCWGEDFDPTPHIGHLQSSTESQANVTAKVAWRVDTTRLQKSKERLGNILLTVTNAELHETTPTTIVFMTYSSISLHCKICVYKFRFQQMHVILKLTKNNLYGSDFKPVTMILLVTLIWEDPKKYEVAFVAQLPPELWWRNGVRPSGDRSLELSGNYCSTTTFIICMHGQIDELKHPAVVIFVSQKNYGTPRFF